MRFLLLALAAVAAVLAWLVVGGAGAPAAERAAAAATPAGAATAVFAGGCFWCVEADFEKLDGVSDVVSGYTGGIVDHPTYEQVTYEATGHYESVRVTYDPDAVSYRALVDYFFRHIDPLDPDGQFCDKGPSYRSAIFPETADERAAALAAKAAAERALGQKVVTPILDRQKFWIAEEYHQDYYRKNRLKYSIYRRGCGRDARIRALWGAR